MDRDNKFYNVIKNLVTNHRKFSGLETILEDIIDDVYIHSKSVIETINDDSVIDGYLAKVVSTSIITVPKRLNYHNEIKHRSIPLAIPEKTEFSIPVSTNAAEEVKEPKRTELQANIVVEQVENIAEQVPVLAPDDSEDDDNFENMLSEESIQIDETDELSIESGENEPDSLNNNFVDKMINSITEDTIKENGLSNDESEDIFVETEALSENDNSTSIENIEQDNIQDELLDSDEIDENELVNYSEVSNIDDLSDLQVEDNAVTDTENTDDLEIEEENSDLIEENNNILENTEDSVLIDNLNDEDNSVLIDEEENNITDEIHEDNIVSDYDILDTINEESELSKEPESAENIDINTDETNDEELEILELSEPETDEEQIEYTEEDDTLEELDYNELEDNELIEDTIEESDIPEDSFLQEDNSDESFSLDENEEEDDDIILETEDSNMDITLVNDTTDSAFEVLNNNEDVKPIESKFKPIDYSAFNFNSQYKENSSENNNIAAKLIDINKQNPDLNILKIFDLKYKQKLTIEEIMAKMNLEKQEVVDALDKMVELI